MLKCITNSIIKLKMKVDASIEKVKPENYKNYLNMLIYQLKNRIYTKT